MTTGGAQSIKRRECSRTLLGVVQLDEEASLNGCKVGGL